VSANPQLYHDPVPEPRGKKRKLGEAKGLPVPEEGSDDEEVNFFASKAEKKEKKREKKRKADAEENDGEGMGLQEKDDSKPELEMRDEDECKAILRSHRIKITLLSAPAPPAKKAKKSKKSKAEEPVKKKDEHKQIYPQPLTDFADLAKQYGISKRLGENLAREGYKLPTEVQMGSLPLLLRAQQALSSTTEVSSLLGDDEEVDLLTVAPTGSGKTLAFLIPVVNSMIQRRRREGGSVKEGHRLEAIIVAPTKELASQIVNEGRKMAQGTGIKVVGMVKGMKVVESPADKEAADEAQNDNETEEKPEDDGSDKEADDSDSESGSDEEMEKAKANRAAKQARQPVVRADILVTTPLVLLHALQQQGRQTTPLPTVRHLILDEADVLLDPLFRDQTLGIWNACTNPSLHATLWSATMGASIESLAVETLAKRRKSLGISTPAPLIRLVVGLKDSAVPNITHHLTYAATEPGKLLGLRQLLHPVTPCLADSSGPSLRPPFLVFTQTIPRAVALHAELKYDIPAEAGGSSRIAVLHSDLSDAARGDVMSRFRRGDIWVLITTDVLSRGVDFKGVNGVVNYDIPPSGASYIHRVGRTGRAGRDGGVAVTFYTKEDVPFVKPIANIIAASEKAAGKSEGERGVQDWLLKSLPEVGKKERKDLKMHGVEVRRAGPQEVQKGRGRVQISTKSGYERKVEQRRKGAVQGSKRRAAKMAEEGGDGGESDFGGFDD
jgi:ATP-dependent RNA helicase DDX52/ROK1